MSLKKKVGILQAISLAIIWGGIFISYMFVPDAYHEDVVFYTTLCAWLTAWWGCGMVTEAK